MMIRLVLVAPQAYEISYRFVLAGRHGSVAINMRSLYLAGNWNFSAQQLCDSAGPCDPSKHDNCINETGAARFAD